MGLTPREMNAAIIANMPKKTGKTLAQWVEVLRRHGPTAPGDRMAWLKSEHGLGHFQAQVIAQEAEGGGATEALEEDPGDLAEAQYAGAKAGLKPIRDRLLEVVRSIDPEVRVEPCKTYIALMRKRQFAVLRPSTAHRLDLGLALQGVEPTERLQPARSLGTSRRITHRLALESPAQIDDEVIHWLKVAHREGR